MCNLSTGIEERAAERAAERATKNTTEKIILNMYRSFKCRFKGIEKSVPFLIPLQNNLYNVYQRFMKKLLPR